MRDIVLPTNQADLTPFLLIFGLILIIVIAVLLFLLVSRNEELRELRAAHQKILQSFNELDEQAKLIVKTDLELNRAQEELERRLTGLNSLQEFAKKINMTIDENDVFLKIDHALIRALGFSSACILTFTDENTLMCRSNVGMDANKLESSLPLFLKQNILLTPLNNGETLSSLSSPPKIKTAVTELFNTEHFILAPLTTQKKLAGVLLVGNNYQSPAVTEGDEEILSILASQIARTIENSQLFEQVYRSSQMLETKVNERTKELSQALKDVEEISKKKTEFISSVSHELRTPLTSIKGYAAILMTGKVGAIPDAVKERIAKINLHSDNLVKLINDLLDIARIESGRVEMKTSPAPMKPLLDTIADLLTPQFTSKNLTLRLQIPEDLPEIEIDRSQIERVFINLLSNAVKFTPPGGTVTVNALARLDREEAAFEVADTGIGIRKEDLSRIFDEFYRVDNEINMNVKGTGLGLALAQNIVQAHGGRMWVTSDVGSGTSFHFTLPFFHNKAGSTPQQQPQGDA